MTDAIWAAEVAAVGPDSVTVTFVSEADDIVTTTIGGAEMATTGPFHVVELAGLEPDTEYDIAIAGVPYDELVPASVRTLPQPTGALLARVATVNDVHFGETVCGMIHDTPEDVLGPWVRAAPGEDPYPLVMNRAAAAEIEAFDPDVVIAKGDLTCVGSEEEYQQFLDTYGRFGDRLHHVRGNHDAMLDPTLALEGAPYAVDAGGATLAVIDTVRPTAAGGRITSEQLGWLEATARETSGPVLVFGHHQIWDIHAPDRPADYFGVDPDSSEAFAAVVGRCENVVGYFAGHTHRNRVRRSLRARRVPFVEVSCTKDYPGVWAEYRIYEHGFVQVVHRISAPAALEWTERTRPMFAGLYRAYALGHLDHRCFTETW
ncbi:MAG: metallophosphoesterase family protein [Acidimicrobiia bacterium]